MPTVTGSEKKVAIIEIGDIRTDGRCRNIAGSIKRFGMEVTFIGPGGKDEEFELNGVRVKRLAVIEWLGSKVMFFHFWIRAFWFTVLMRPSLIVAEDLYSLPAALAAKFFTYSKVLYDSKELYFAVAALRNRLVTQRFWSAVEKICIRFVDGVITSGERDSDLIGQRYAIPRPVTIHNHPPRRLHPGDKNILRRKFSIPEVYTILLYQGWLLHGRGLFHLIEIAASIGKAFLVIMGDGPLRSELENFARSKNVDDRVVFTGAMSYEEMLEHTPGGDIGCAIIEDYGLSYRHARPNKMFEYIQANIPVLVSTMPAMEEVVRDWGIGTAVLPDDLSSMIQAIRRFIDEPEFYKRCVENCKKAAAVFHWEEEEKTLIALLQAMA